MRIGIFTDTFTPDINGVVSSEVTLAKALRRQGHEVFIITNHPGAKVKFEDNVLYLPGVTLKGLYGYKFSLPMNFKAEDLVEEMNLDVIHIQTDFGVGLFGRQMARTQNIPAVYTYHTMYEDYTHYVNPMDFSAVEKTSKAAIRSLSRVLSHSMQAMIAPSQKTKETLQRYGIKTPIYVVPTGLDLSKFNPDSLDPDRIQEIRHQVNADPEAHLVVFIGRIAEEKSIDMLIEGIAASQDEKLELVIVGAGPDEKKFQNLARDLKVEDKVHFTGKVPAPDIPYYYAAFDIFASASLSETQGMTYLEALAAGKMVAGRRDEVLEGLVDEGVSGFYFDTPQELAEKMAEFFSHREQYPGGQVCLKKVAPYTDEMFAHKVHSVYEQALDDYMHTYTVAKTRMFDDFVMLNLERDSDDDSTRIFVPMDDFMELKIMTNTRLDAYLVESYLEMQPYYQALMKIKDRLLVRDYTESQVKRYCMEKLGLNEANAKAAVEEMKNRSLIDNRAYAIDKADYWHSYGQSKNQIRNKLMKAGVEKTDIDEALGRLSTESELENARKLARRLVNSIKEQSSMMKRRTVVSKLLSKGYSMDIARQATEQVTIDQTDEDALMVAFQKAKRLYSTLPEPKRTQKIKIYCMRKGFSGSMLNSILEGEQGEDDEN